MKIKLGQEVKDKVTGFKGIAVNRTEFLEGCARVEVQRPVDQDGKMTESAAFDEPMLEVIGRGILPPEREKPGGPHRGHNPGRPLPKSI